MALIRFLRIDDNDELPIDHDPAADSFDISNMSFGGVDIGAAGAGVDGPTVINDDSSNYTNFTPAGDTLRETLEAIDAALSAAANTSICNPYTNGNGGAITIGQAVYISANDTVDLADRDLVAQDDVIGVVGETSIASAASGLICSEGIVPGALTGATAGQKQWLGSTPGQVTSTPPAGGSGQTAYLIGYAKNATDLHLTRRFVGRRRP